MAHDKHHAITAVYIAFAVEILNFLSNSAKGGGKCLGFFVFGIKGVVAPSIQHCLRGGGKVSHDLVGKQIEKIAVAIRIAKQINPTALEIIVTPVRC